MEFYCTSGVDMINDQFLQGPNTLKVLFGFLHFLILLKILFFGILFVCPKY